MHRTAATLGAALVIAAGSATARATWSILLVDTRTGEIAMGSATCLTGFDLRANTPVLIPGVGAATAQSFVDTTGQNRVFIRDRLALGVAPQDILAQLAAFDPGHQTRQYGIVDAMGRTATFSGTGDGQWAGGQTGAFNSVYAGQIGHIAYAIQGNVLTGPPVVQMAVAAAINAGGDLPAKLMAAMQAARSMGGDGRCSCSPSMPTGCGSPPPSFTKSAHIGYMLVARAGDVEGCNGIYRTLSGPAAVRTADLTGDSYPELIFTNASSAALAVLTNLSGTLPPALRPVFAPLATSYSTGNGPRGFVLADMNGDLLPDAVTANSTAGSMNVLAGQPGGGFSLLTGNATGANPRNVAVGDFDGVHGPDIATANFNANTVSVFRNDGTGFFAGAGSVAVPGGPNDIAAANVVGSPALDLIVLARTSNQLVILRGVGDGTFVPDQTLPTATGAVALVAADVDGDGATDLAAACDSGHAVQVFLNNAGVFTPVSYTLTFQPTCLAVGDVNGDQAPDLVAGGQGSFATLFNDGEGAFTIDRTYTMMGTTIASAALSDLDGDGDLDASFIAGGAGVETVKNLGPGPLQGTFNNGLGCATGDYFMNFNVAFQQAGDPDPVITLQNLYNQWRTGLVGRPDAVQSLVSISPPYLPSIGSGDATMTIRLRDWQGAPITAPIPSIAVEHAPGSPQLVAIGPVQAQGGGLYTVMLHGGSAPGLDHFRIRVDDGVRPVLLMPDPALSIYAGACYANCDGSSGPPILNMNDFMCFQTRFAAGDPYANCDGSAAAPAFNIQDFICFQYRFAAGCP